MKRDIDAIYENGTFRPLKPQAVEIPEGRQVRITVDDEIDPEALRLATRVYDGLSDQDIEDVEQIALDRSRFFGMRSAD